MTALLNPDTRRLLSITTVDRLNGEDQAWRDFVDQCPDATFFHRLEWRDVIARSFGFATPYLMARRAGEVVGILPLVLIRSRLFGSRLTSMPFGVYGGPAAVDEEAYLALAAEAVRLAMALDVDYVEFKSRNPSFAHGWVALTDQYVVYKRLLPDRPDKLMAALPGKRRNMVRKGQKSGLVVIHEEESIDRFYAVYSESLRNLGTPILPHRFFKAVWEAFGPDAQIMTIAKDGQDITSSMSFYHKGESTPFYSGGTPQARTTAAFDLMYYELQEFAIEKGCLVYDFGRSRVGTGSGEFKELWGFTPEPLAYEYFMMNGGAVPRNNPSNPRYRRMINLWQRLPLPVAGWLGARIAPRLG